MSSTESAEHIGYRRPPPAILAVLDAAQPPGIIVSPARDALLLVRTERYPSIADVAAPMLRLAGLRIDPRTNGPHTPTHITELTLVSLPAGEHRPVPLPPGRFGVPLFAPDGQRFVLTNTTDAGIELWLGDVASAEIRPIRGVRLSAGTGSTAQWLPDGGSLLCQIVPANRGEPPSPPAVPAGPIIQQSDGRAGPARTFADLLQNAHDEALLDYYATAQLVIVDLERETCTTIGQPGIFAEISPSPSGEHWLVVRIRRPYSYLYPISAFPHDVEIWDACGTPIAVIARQPLQDLVPIEGVPTGPRAVQWALAEPDRLLWVEALDGGDPRTVVPFRDALLSLSAPFRGNAESVLNLEHRFAGIAHDESGRWSLLRDYDRDRRWRRTFVMDAQGVGAPRLIWDQSIHDRYGDPGTPLQRTLPNALRAMVCRDDSLALVGAGATPEGDRPFLDRFDLPTAMAARLFQSAADGYEVPFALLDDDAFLTRHEAPASPPNLRLRQAGSDQFRALTRFTDPTPQLRGIEKRLVTFQRGDGVPLSFTLYLPPDRKPNERLPTVVWAYPQEFVSADTAGQVSGSPQRFTTLSGPTHLFFLLAGYAVLDGVTMPVVGDPETANDTFIEQIASSAEAAIAKATELGVTDPDRVGVGGHSYGAFMAVNLLAHTRLFRAGIARSGAYNRTLTPFGFQNERRTLWEAGDIYARLSPFQYAHKIAAPVLLIHGADDDNPGTFPLQSERMYQAIRGTGGKVRYVVLPHESHGYVARESIEHVLCEMIEWFDRYVKRQPGLGY